MGKKIMKEALRKNEAMSRLVRHIEDNLPDALDTGLLARAGTVSCAQLYRDFYSVTGHSVKEYVRKRRLSTALALIKTSDAGLTDIALQCGYSSHQALCRAVKQALGITPSEYEKSDSYYFFPAWKGEPPRPVTVSSEAVPRTLRVLFFHSNIQNIENRAVHAFLQAFPDYTGRIFGRNGEQAGSRLCYELSLTDTGLDYRKLNRYGFEAAHEVPSFTAVFATVTVPNDESQINAAWDYLYSEWLQSSMFEYTDEPYFEEYIVGDAHLGVPKIKKLKLYLPIRKRYEATKISLIGNPGLRFIVSKAKGYDAEKIASQTVIDYLTARYPYIVRASKEFFLRKEMDSYLCGVRVKSELRISEEENVENIVTDQNQYLLLESSVTGEYDRYAELLLSFARDHGMTVDPKKLFAVYDARESFDHPKIKMFCPVKIEKN